MNSVVALRNREQMSDPTDPVTDWPAYACPETQRALTREGPFLVSAGNAHRFPLKGGIPNFNRYPPVETAETAAELVRLNETARSQGCLAALQAGYRHS